MHELPTAKFSWRPSAAFGLVLGVHAGVFLVAQTLPESVTTRHPWARQAVTQGLAAVVALVAMAMSRRPFVDFGFCRPVPAKGHFKLWGLALGAASTGLILAFGLRGMQSSMAGYGLSGIVLWIWVVSSFVEGLLCRGWFQSILPVASESNASGLRTRTAALWSAALFGAMHLPLLFGDIQIATALILFPSVTALGYVCATARARTASLLPAVAAHVMFNIGAFCAGTAYVITYRLATGHLPSGLR